MTSKEQLLKKLSSLNLDAYETASDINKDSAIELLNLNELCRFIQKHNIDTVLYYYSFATPDDLLIDDEVIDEVGLDDDVLSVIQNKIDSHNESVFNLDFTNPYSLTVFCTYQGFIYYISEYDEWFRDEGYEMPSAMLLQFATDHLEEIVDKKESSKEERLLGREQLRQQILNDPDFFRCTNQQLRRAYANKLFQGNEKLQGLFYSKQHGLYDISINTFVDEIWRDYKNQKIDNK